jgi:hypothetical protein
MVCVGGGAVTTTFAPETREVHAPADAIIALRPSTTLLVVFLIFMSIFAFPGIEDRRHAAY